MASQPNKFLNGCCWPIKDGVSRPTATGTEGDRSFSYGEGGSRPSYRLVSIGWNQGIGSETDLSAHACLLNSHPRWIGLDGTCPLTMFSSVLKKNFIAEQQLSYLCLSAIGQWHWDEGDEKEARCRARFLFSFRRRVKRMKGSPLTAPKQNNAPRLGSGRSWPIRPRRCILFAHLGKQGLIIMRLLSCLIFHVFRMLTLS